MTSLVSTVFNEIDGIERLMDSITAQTKQPDEIVIVDGGSSDGTWEYISRLNITAHLAPICNIKYHPSPVALGRNMAVKLSRGERIVVTDGGCVLDPKFIEEITKPQTDVVGGWTEINQRNDIQHCASLIYSSTREKMLDVRNVPSRAICFTREIFNRVGGYPEVCLTAEDSLFNENLMRAGASYTFTDKAVVKWNAPDTLSGLLRQSYRYAKGDGICGTNSRMYLSKIIKYGLL
jgi:glycosyltransferase involved in cell wall biosynthesis